jgi:hypothetical protein
LENPVIVESDAPILCKRILEIDRSIIFSSVCTLSGEELAYAVEPSVGLLVGGNEQMKQQYGRNIAMMLDTLSIGEKTLGDLSSVVTTYRNVKLVIIPERQFGIAVVLVTTRDAVSNHDIFQVSKAVSEFFKK